MNVYSGSRRKRRLQNRPKGEKSGGLSGKNNNNNKKGTNEPDLREYIRKRDWSGSYAILEVYEDDNRDHKDLDVPSWLGYCYFHLGEYSKAMKVYQKLLIDRKEVKYHLYIGCCYYFHGMFEECKDEAIKGPDCDLKDRILFHVNDRLKNEEEVRKYHGKLQDNKLIDQLSLASLEFTRNHYQDAVDIYKKILVENSEYLALHVYIALCYYKIDYSDISQDVLKIYLKAFPKSVIATNLKACNTFKMVSGKAAEDELQKMVDLQNSSFNIENLLIRHNLVVFKDGEGALQTLPSMVGLIPEARLNLVIYYLRVDEVEKAFELIKDLDPVKVPEFILKGVVYTTIGQKEDSREKLRRAQQYYKTIGSSDAECDTIPGRQCMASCFFLNKQFDDVLIYLKSIEEFFGTSCEFNWNFGIAKASNGLFKEAEECFLKVENQKMTNDFVYLSWLARCYIMNGKPEAAWELYLKMESNDFMKDLIQLIANDCYRVGHFWYAAKAFDILERLDPNPEFWQAKKGACIGTFQLIIAGKKNKNLLSDVILLIASSQKPKVETIVNIMKTWAEQNQVQLDI